MESQAEVSWREVQRDWLLLLVAVASMVVSLLYDIAQGHHYFFQLSSGVMFVAVAWLGSRSLSKHWIKAERSHNRCYWLKTSRKQNFVDGCTLVITIVGIVVGSYGDKIFKSLFLE